MWAETSDISLYISTPDAVKFKGQFQIRMGVRMDKISAVLKYSSGNQQSKAAAPNPTQGKNNHQAVPTSEV